MFSAATIETNESDYQYVRRHNNIIIIKFVHSPYRLPTVLFDAVLFFLFFSTSNYVRSDRRDLQLDCSERFSTPIHSQTWCAVASGCMLVICCLPTRYYTTAKSVEYNILNIVCLNILLLPFYVPIVFDIYRYNYTTALTASVSNLLFIILKYVIRTASTYLRWYFRYK